MSSEKYKEFRNYMTNELGITKTDIEAWTKESVATEVVKKLKQIDVMRIITDAVNKESKNQVESALQSTIYNARQTIKDTVAKELASRITVSLTS